MDTKNHYSNLWVRHTKGKGRSNLNHLTEAVPSIALDTVIKSKQKKKLRTDLYPEPVKLEQSLAHTYEDLSTNQYERTFKSKSVMGVKGQKVPIEGIFTLIK